ncbi:N-acetyl-gamma-glutamyl-phosphate reductase [Desulfobacterales bacterium HSG16]|nr:N-acetyl-gamma-glutamyl-phosphate reductase [Desulfobacterales bacterium HSG16]
MIRAGVIGATGYAGAELVRILTGHPDVEITMLTSRQYADVRFSDIYPAFTGHADMICQTFDPGRTCDACDVIFTALPHKIPMSIVPDLIEKGKKVIDLSADFRFSNVENYESSYQPHSAKDLLKKAVYGLCEVYHEKIKTSDLIGNPGCYPTSTLLPLIPLIKKNMIDCKTIIVDSKSGTSGAGRSLSLGAHYCEVTESFKAYKVAQHRHNPEMNEVLSREAGPGKNVSITFVPHLVPMSRGMLTTTYASLAGDISDESLRACLESFYKDRPFVRLCRDGKVPDTRNVRGTNYCDIGFKTDRVNGRVILISAIDNLVKGAAGQAVQNMNIMTGLDETRGLLQVPYPL